MIGAVDQLLQFVSGPVWDGNLISKSDRDRLVEAGFVERTAGWNFLSKKGVELCAAMRFIAF